MKKLLLWLIFAIVVIPADAQEQCPVADSISYPFDTETFMLAQDFGVASPRHQGRFHTGEDWRTVSGVTQGQPVRAIANGRVTYSSPTGWGRDGGVIILEHTFSDGTVIYSQYGHITESDTVTFPPRFGCIEAGEIIAVVGDSRPAPHLHFEIRVNSPDIPGPGYTREDPFTLGWRRPSQFVVNQRAWLQPSYRWHTLNSTYTPPPLVLNDNSMMMIDGGLLRGITNDGRVLWRVALEGEAVSLLGFEGNPYLTYADGDIVQVDFDGTPLDRWNIDFAPDMPPFMVGNLPVYHTSDNTLTMLTADQSEIVWVVEGIPRYSRVQIAGTMIALVSERGDQLYILANDGRLLDTATLRDGADMASAPDGSLIVYTQGGLWRVDDTGTWTELFAGVAPGGGSGAVAVMDDGRVYLLDGENIYAYAPDGTLNWEARLPLAINGQAELTPYGNGLLITSTHGDIVMVRASGGICGFTQIHGDDRAGMWHQVGTDNILRVMVGDQVIGLDWTQFAGSCIVEE